MGDSGCPHCFGDLETVFPKGKNGLRQSPSTCMVCVCKTACLRKAMSEPAAVGVRQEMIDRAYRGGLIGTIQRWSRKKALARLKQSS